METVLRVIALLLVAFSLRIDVLARSHNENKKSSSLQPIRDDGMTLESFMDEGGDDVSTFGADILQEFHFQTMECRMNITKLEFHYQVRIKKLFKYFHDVKKAVRSPSFTKLIKHNRQDVERNVHATMSNLEREHVVKMRASRKACDRDAHVWLESKLAEAVNLAKRYVGTNPSLFENFLERIRLFQSKLYSHKTMCARGRGTENTTVTCELNDLQLLLNFTTTLIGRMNYVRDVYVFSDDEEPPGSRSKAGSGTMEDDEDRVDELVSSATSRLEDSINLEETEDETPPLDTNPMLSRSSPYSRQAPPKPEKSLLQIHIKADMEQTTPIESDAHLTTGKPSGSEGDTKQTASTESGNDLTDGPGDVLSEVISHTTSHLTRSKDEYPTPASTTTGFHGSDKELMNAEEFQGDEHPEDPQAVSEDGAMVESLGEDVPEPDDGNTSVQSSTTSEQAQPANEEEVASDSGSVVILEDPKQLINDKSNHTHPGNTHQVLVILAVLVAVVLLAALVVVAVLIFLAAKKRQQQKTGYTRVLLTSETEATNETLEGIKKDGYVNPTYKFYTRC